MANSSNVIAVTDTTSKRDIVYERKKRNEEESEVTRKGIGSF